MITAAREGLAESTQRRVLHRTRTEMKLVTAIIKPFLLEEVRDALIAAGVAGLTITEVKGFGAQRGHAEIYGGEEFSVHFVSKLRVEIVVMEKNLAKAIDAICGSARTGTVGDGKIFVTPIERAVRIRTGETDIYAI